MGRKRSEKIASVKEKLIMRLGSGYYYPGDRFFSNRSIAERFNVSYQTAHQLMRELRDEGWLDRRPFSGSYISGRIEPVAGVTLHFNARAKRPESFGDRLLAMLLERLGKERIPCRIDWDDAGKLDGTSLPILWESPKTLERLIGAPKFGILLNDRPRNGIARTFVDSVSIDDFSGGALAAEIVIKKFGVEARTAVLGGSSEDTRNLERIRGFRSLLPDAELVDAGGWNYTDGMRASPAVTARERDAVFCCNDRLASALAHHCAEARPGFRAVIGFDNAPVSERENLTTIAIPWEQLIDLTLGIVRQRMAGETQTSVQYLINTTPIIRDPVFL
jgi:hypothetical protein